MTNKLMATIAIIVWALSVTIALADTANVTNDVSVSANSGGNNAQGGTAVKGSGVASIHVEQTINGVAQPSIDIETSTESGSVQVNVDSNVSSSGTSVNASRHVEINAEIASGTVPAPVFHAPNKQHRTPAQHPSSTGSDQIFHATLFPTASGTASSATIPSSSQPESTPPGFVAQIGSFFKNIFGWIFHLRF